MNYYWLPANFFSFVCSFTAGHVIWNVAVTSSLYKDFKLIVPNNTLLPRYFNGVSNPELACARTCVWTKDCVAVNLMSWDTTSFCELLSDNLCSNDPTVILQPQPNAQIWDKDPQNYRTCLSQRLATTVPANYCEIIRPGCRGTWPDCTDCLQTCGDCLKRYNYTIGGNFNCTLWPGATSWQDTPILTYCYGNYPILMSRKVNLVTGRAEEYIMPFVDMNRFIQLNFYNQLYFYFKPGRGSYTSYYRDPYITANGTLSNLTFFSSATGDGLHLNGMQLGPTPFVWVNDDRYSCGSFWLFDQQNATYCPGGQVSLFGTPRVNSTGHVTETGIHWPLANGSLLYQAEIYLRFYSTSTSG